jgi:hypothetical protein
MFSSFNTPRAIWSAAFVIGSLCVLPGCKHVYRGSGFESSVSGSPVQSYVGEPMPDSSASHEPLPELSPVPPLPGAGHSPAPEPVPPPAPSEPTSAQAEPETPPMSQTKSLWSQPSARGSIRKSSPTNSLATIRQGRHAAMASNVVPKQTVDPRFAAIPYRVAGSNPGSGPITSKNHETTAQDFPALGNPAGEHNSHSIESVSSPALRGGLSFPAARSTFAELESVGPHITPRQQPSTTRNGVIEDWPDRSQPAKLAANSRTNLAPPQLRNVPTAPSNASALGSFQATPAVAQDGASVPSLLPPGP